MQDTAWHKSNRWIACIAVKMRLNIGIFVLQWSYLSTIVHRARWRSVRTVRLCFWLFDTYHSMSHSSGWCLSVLYLRVILFLPLFHWCPLQCLFSSSIIICWTCPNHLSCRFYIPTPKVGGIKRWCASVCLTSVCLTSVSVCRIHRA